MANILLKKYNFSLKNMSSFDETWTDLEFVQEVLEQSPRGYNLVWLDKLKSSEYRICYTKKTIENNLQNTHQAYGL